MFRFLPPHLFVLVTLLAFVVWLMLVHQFRKSAVTQRLVAEVFGDDTPETALRTFEAAKHRLSEHLNNGDLDGKTRERIEVALGLVAKDQVVGAFADNRSV